MTDDKPVSNDEAILQMLAGANFGPDANLILPSGKKLSGDEAQAWTSVYAADSEQDEAKPRKSSWWKGRKSK